MRTFSQTDTSLRKMSFTTVFASVLTSYPSPTTGWWISWPARWCDRKTPHQTRNLWLKCSSVCPVWFPRGKVKHHSAWSQTERRAVNNPVWRKLQFNVCLLWVTLWRVVCGSLAGCMWWPRCSTCPPPGPAARSSRSRALKGEKTTDRKHHCQKISL